MLQVIKQNIEDNNGKFDIISVPEVMNENKNDQNILNLKGKNIHLEDIEEKKQGQDDSDNDMNIDEKGVD